jgi:ADP-ribose pyrophosphatase YjhB (NUDIX family)
MGRLPVINQLLRLLLRLWRILPLWVHVFAARVVRPKYRVAAVFDEQGCVLLFRHTYRKFEWGMPSGGLEYGEAPEEAIRREFHEESGIDVEVQKMLLAVSSKEDHHISLIYGCRILSGEFRPSPEISEMQYFDPQRLPRMLLTEKAIIARLAALNREGK